VTTLIFDTETTGGDDPKMIEAAGIVLRPGDIDLRPTDHFESRYNPGIPSTLGALATHHILDSELVGCPPPNFLLPDDVEYLIGHNIDYDWRVIGEPKVKRICTLALARFLHPEIDSHTLGALAYFYLGEPAREMLRSAHSAAGDCETLRHILRHIIVEVRERASAGTWKDLWQVSEAARVPSVFSFGKHKGTPIKDAPLDYIEWMLRQDDIDPYLRSALKERTGKSRDI
jgi:exodeoxyribonuclease X